MSSDYSLSLGCHNLTGGSSYRRSERVVRCALELGIRRFDVAPSYGLGTAEHTLARALGHRRSDADIEITTKFGIPAPRLGQLKAWLREPYRMVRGLRGVPAPAAPTFTRPHTQSKPSSTPFDIKAAAGRSLRALQIECIGAFLIHERIDGVAARVRDDLSALRAQGLISKSGCSGAIQNVRDMIELAGPIAAVAQTSIFDWRALPSIAERRFFNIGALGNSLRAELPRTGAVAEALRDIGASETREGEAGLFIAIAMAWIGRRFPDAILIVNASTPERLTAVVSSARSSAIRDWVSAFDADVERLIERRDAEPQRHLGPV